MSEADRSNTLFKPTPAIAMVQDVVGCKWSLTVLQLIRQGIRRPGSMQRSVDGLTTKVLNERLKKLIRYRLLKRCTYAEVPPRVEYYLTDLGEKFVGILDQFDTLLLHKD